MSKPTMRWTKARILRYYALRRARDQWWFTMLIVFPSMGWIGTNYSLTVIVLSAIVGVVAVSVTASRFSNAERDYKEA